MRGQVQQIPVEARLEIPLTALPEFLSHEQQLLAGICPQETIVRPKRRELLPRIARHAGQQRTLAVHDLVVRQRKHEILGERIGQSERDAVVVPTPVHRRLLQVGQRVVHPPHVPLEAETQAARMGRRGNQRPGRGLLGDRDDAGVVRVDRFVQLAQEGDRLEILVSAVPVGKPLSFPARIVEVEHRRHGVHAQSVHVIAIEPEQRVGDQVVGDFRPAEVEDGGIPVGMQARSWIRVLVECRAVELRQAMRIRGKVRGNPVKYHAKPRLMAAIDETRETRRFAESRCRGEEADRLISPRRVVRILADRRQLEMREAQSDRIGDQRFRQLVVVEPAARLRRGATNPDALRGSPSARAADPAARARTSSRRRSTEIATCRAPRMPSKVAARRRSLPDPP